MGSYNVLVTAISGNVGNGILKCLINDKCINNLYGCDINAYPCGINKVKRFFQVSPCSRGKDYLREILDVCKNYEINLLIPSNEAEIKFLSDNRKVFDDMGVKLLVHDETIYDVFFDKYKTIDLMRELEIPAIETYYADEYDGRMGFPVVIKEVFSCGSKGVHVARNENDLKAYGHLGHEQIIQKYVGTIESEFTVPVYAEGDGKKVFFIPLKRKLSSTGYTEFIEPTKEKDREDIRNICTKIAKHFHLKGSINLQMRKHDGKFYVFECNPRLSGTVYFREQLGFRDALWWGHLIMGEKENIDFHYPPPFVGIRELNEIIYYM